MTALAARWTLAPDFRCRSRGKKPVTAGFKGDKRVFQDATRKFEVDMFNLPPANDPVPTAGDRQFHAVVSSIRK